MSEEDKKWLEEAMKAYTFSDTDRMKELLKEMSEAPSTADKLDELEELIEQHPANGFNLCLMGGMPTLLRHIFEHPDPKCR